MSSFATLYADGCARPPAIQATLKVTNASRPQIAAMRGGTSETDAFGAFDGAREVDSRRDVGFPEDVAQVRLEDRKSTRLNSSHMSISYAVFCLKKKNNFTATEFCRNFSLNEQTTGIIGFERRNGADERCG